MPKQPLVKYKMTEAVRARLEPWHREWLPKATNCDAMTDDDRAIMRRAVSELYRAAGLTPPPPERIVFVRSPLVAALAGGFSAAIWHLRSDPDFERTLGGGAATRAATRAATLAATRAATRDATRAAT